MKCRADAGSAFSRDNTVMILHHLLDNSQPDARPGENTSRVKPLENFKDLVTLLLWKPDAVVRHGDMVILVSAGQHLSWYVWYLDGLCPDGDPWSLVRPRKLNGIRNQVQEHLAHLV